MSLISALQTILLLTYTADAQNVNSTDHPDRIGWYGGGDTRGTMDIIWGCLLTLFLCVWTVLHLNIPRVRMSTQKLIERKASWMAAAAFTPEFITAMALEDYLAARESVKLMKNLEYDQWNMVHAHYVNMGGVKLIPENREAFLPTASDIHLLLSSDNKLSIPQPTKHEIEDKSKSDYLAKALACLSATWLTVQVIGRVSSGLPITVLELVTVAFVPCSLLSYCLWWQKPQDIHTPSTIHCGPIADHIWNQLENIRVAEVKPSKLRSLLSKRYEDPLAKQVSRVFYCFTVWAEIVDYAKSIYLALCVVGVFFGAMHCIAWNFSFPSKREQLLWRIFSLIATVIPGFFYLVGIWCRKVHNRSVPNAIYFPFFVIYFAARLYLWYETFASLKSVPFDVYRDLEWASFVPHF